MVLACRTFGMNAIIDNGLFHA